MDWTSFELESSEMQKANVAFMCNVLWIAYLVYCFDGSVWSVALFLIHLIKQFFIRFLLKSVFSLIHGIHAIINKNMWCVQ